jgi:hypothetical protein
MSASILPSGLAQTLAKTTATVAATVADGHNALDLQLSGQTYVELLRDGNVVMRAATTQGAMSVSIPPGDYTIRSDGAVTTGASRDAAAPSLTPAAPTPTTTAPTNAIPSDAAGPPDLPFLRPPLQLSSDAAKRNEIDGIACIPADGKSFTTITVRQTAAAAGGPTQTVYLRATGGAIMDAAGSRVIRSLDLQGGAGTFRLVSQSQPGLVTVWVLEGPPPRRVSIEVEFTPP